MRFAVCLVTTKFAEYLIVSTNLNRHWLALVQVELIIIRLRQTVLYPDDPRGFWTTERRLESLSPHTEAQTEFRWFFETMTLLTILLKFLALIETPARSYLGTVGMQFPLYPTCGHFL
jgi:hypothetical protein